MICEKQGYHRILVRLLLTLADYSMELTENHDARYDSPRLMPVYLMVRNNCKSLAAVQ